ncbi:Octapeptide-repeat protein T2, partial [Ophiophagus hannah]
MLSVWPGSIELVVTIPGSSENHLYCACATLCTCVTITDAFFPTHPAQSLLIAHVRSAAAAVTCQPAIAVSEALQAPVAYMPLPAPVESRLLGWPQPPPLLPDSRAGLGCHCHAAALSTHGLASFPSNHPCLACLATSAVAPCDTHGLASFPSHLPGLLVVKRKPASRPHLDSPQLHDAMPPISSLACCPFPAAPSLCHPLACTLWLNEGCCCENDVTALPSPPSALSSSPWNSHSGSPHLAKTLGPLREGRCGQLSLVLPSCLLHTHPSSLWKQQVGHWQAFPRWQGGSLFSHRIVQIRQGGQWPQTRQTLPGGCDGQELARRRGGVLVFGIPFEFIFQVVPWPAGFGSLQGEAAAFADREVAGTAALGHAWGWCHIFRGLCLSHGHLFQRHRSGQGLTSQPLQETPMPGNHRDPRLPLRTLTDLRWPWHGLLFLVVGPSSTTLHPAQPVAALVVPALPAGGQRRMARATAGKAHSWEVTLEGEREGGRERIERGREREKEERKREKERERREREGEKGEEGKREEERGKEEEREKKEGEERERGKEKEEARKKKKKGERKEEKR